MTSQPDASVLEKPEPPNKASAAAPDKVAGAGIQAEARSESEALEAKLEQLKKHVCAAGWVL